MEITLVCGHTIDVWVYKYQNQSQFYCGKCGKMIDRADKNKSHTEFTGEIEPLIIDGNDKSFEYQTPNLLLMTHRIENEILKEEDNLLSQVTKTTSKIWANFSSSCPKCEETTFKILGEKVISKDAFTKNKRDVTVTIETKMQCENCGKILTEKYNLSKKVV